MRVGRLFRSVDAKFLLALTAFLVVGTICYGFVQRGDHITAAEDSVSALSSQLGDLSAENQRLRSKLDTIQHKSAVRDRQAARERDALLRELLRLNEYLRSHGISTPVYTVYTPRTYVAPSAGRDTPSPSRPSSSGGHAPGNSGGHSHHHGHGHGHSSGRLIPALPGIPNLP